ncbi:MAG: heat-inducible transcription repressor HrcA [Anaerolineales bacterium]|nr:heat-inducible transcription repressor HrcA [Anaerolineales bacterium]
MQTLSERQKIILGLVIRDYVETAQPVGSRHLVDRYGLDFSSATIRNEMAALADAGLIRQPHTSAGRIPTEDGYRYFVGQLMHNPNLPASSRHTISHQFYQARYDTEKWIKLAASILAHQVNSAALITSPITQSARFKHLELIATSGRQVLLVWVLMSGKVIQQLLFLDEPLPQQKLSAIAAEINNTFYNKEIADILKMTPSLDDLGKEIHRMIAEESISDSVISNDIYYDGWSNVLAEPEFSNTEAATKALKVLEERTLLENLLTQTIINTDIGGVQVLIGGEGYLEALSDFSLVLARYGKQGIATGVLGVMGPLRMPYSKAISTVNFVAGLLSEIVIETMAE